MRIENARLCDDQGEPVRFVASPNVSNGIEPRFLVIHYTAGRSMERSIATLTNKARKASAHLVIGRDGSITQLVPFDKRSWHAGKSRWGNLVGMNRYSIGIELDNPGKLQRRRDGWYTWFGTRVDDALVIEAAHPSDGPVCGWHVYPEAQVEVVQEVAETLFDGYGLQDVIGHQDIAPGRKLDPGPAFPMAQLRALLVGREEDELDVGDEYPPEQLHVTRTRLNLRQEPSSAANKLATLPEGCRLAVVDRQGSWARVDVLTDLDGDQDTDLEGWVAGRYLARG